MKSTPMVSLVAAFLLAVCQATCAQSASDANRALLEKGEAGDTQALKTLNENAVNGDAEAQFSLGIMYEKGHGVTQSYTDAATWLRKAADQGHAMAQNNLGVLYANGRGVPQDEIQAEQWYRKAAVQGYAVAQNNLGVLYANGRTLVSDLTREVHHGVLTERRQAIVQDDVEAAKWYRFAAEQGYAAAQFNLALMIGAGRGVAKDDFVAANWYRKAAEQGHVEAQFNLGVRFANGRGVAQDNVQAYKWWTLVKANSDPSGNLHESAGQNLAVLDAKMSVADVARAKQAAAAWLSARSGL